MSHLKNNSDSDYTFQTSRLWLRPTDLDDAPFIFELMNTPKWYKYIGDRNIKTIQDAESYIKIKMLPQLDRLGFGNFTVVLKSDNSKIGTCGLYDREGLEGLDIGFAFLPQFEKKGYAFEASRVVLKAAFESFGYNRIGAITSKENEASIRLCKKLGMNYVKDVRLPNDDEDLSYFEIVKASDK